MGKSPQNVMKQLSRIWVVLMIITGVFHLSYFEGISPLNVMKHVSPILVEVLLRIRGVSRFELVPPKYFHMTTACYVMKHVSPILVEVLIRIRGVSSAIILKSDPF